MSTTLGMEPNTPSFLGEAVESVEGQDCFLYFCHICYNYTMRKILLIAFAFLAAKERETLPGGSK